MTDRARRDTDKRLREIEAELKKQYKEAQAEITSKWNDYMARVKPRLDKLYKEYLNAPAGQKREAKKRYQEALESYTLRNQKYQAMVKDVTYRLSHVNEIATAYMNNKLPEIYTMNYNQKIPGLSKTGIDFTLVDESTVRRMALDGEIELPYKDFNKSKDQVWNRRQINSKVLQGIIQGESVDDIAKRILPIVDNNRASAIRNARTMVTSAENRGRFDRYNDLEDRGLIMKKVWIATPDDRVRESHIDIDGEEQDINSRFTNGCMYPGDGSGPADEVWNCFVADTKIASDSEIIRSYKHKYHGNIISIKTARGIEFSCTPNHPVLTPGGWVAVKSLNRGDNLCITSGINNEVSRRNPDIDHAFPCINTIHEFFNVFGSKRTCNLGVDFHGDIPTSDVEIITSKRFLRVNSDSGSGNSVDKITLKHSNTFTACNSHLVKRFIGIFVAPFSFMRSRCEFLSIFFRHLRHSKIHGLGTITLSDTGRMQTINNNRTRNTELNSESLDGFPGVIFVDKIVNIDIKFSHCDVYNLQTENGYYFVNSIIPQDNEKNNGFFAIAHNCRCSMRSDVIGVRKPDGKVEIFTRYERNTLHQTEIDEERRRRANESNTKN